MAELKTKVTEAKVEDYLAAIKEDQRRADCEAIAKLLGQITKQEPRMWGTSIVGFGSYKYKYASGHSGETCQVGFSSRKGAISVYLGICAAPQRDILAKLGKHKMAKACLYIRRLADIDLKVFEKLVRSSLKVLKLHQASRKKEAALKKVKLQSGQKSDHARSRKKPDEG